MKASCVASDIELFSLGYTSTDIRPGLADINGLDTISESLSYEDFSSV